MAVEEVVKAHLRMAEQNGAELHYEEPVSSWEVVESTDNIGSLVKVTTSEGRPKTLYIYPLQGLDYCLLVSVSVC